MMVTRTQADLALRRAHEIAEGDASRTLPVDIVALGHQLGISSIEPREMIDDGYVGRRSDGTFVIRYRRSNSPERTRFTIAHEIAHLIIARVTGVDIMEAKHRRGCSYEETTANRIAAELLMPERLIHDRLQSAPPDWKTILGMRSVFQVSTTALVRRIIDVEGVLAILIRAPLAKPNGWIRCEASRGKRVFFPAHIDDDVASMIKSLERGQPSSIDILCDGECIQVPCTG